MTRRASGDSGSRGAGGGSRQQSIFAPSQQDQREMPSSLFTMPNGSAATFSARGSFPSYLTPIVAGVGAGRHARRNDRWPETPPATIAGAVSLDPSATVATRRPLAPTCPRRRAEEVFSYGATEKFARLLDGRTYAARPSRGNREYVTTLRREGAPLELHEIAADKAVGRCAAGNDRAASCETARAPANAPEHVSGLPLTELPS